jgi:cobalt transporter subunit CbtA
MFAAVLVGLIAGSLYGGFQQIQINPIIYAAEAYEVDSDNLAPVENQLHEDGSSHRHAALISGQGQKRILLTWLANVLVGIAYSMLLITLMFLHNWKSGKPTINWKSGIAWGLGLMLCIFVAPALVGIHPELPGSLANSLGQRQIWWVFSALSTGLGILTLYYGQNLLKAGGLVLIILPPIIAGPVSLIVGFTTTDVEALIALGKLSHQFMVISALGMLFFCILLGSLSGFASARFVRIPGT